MSRHIAIAYAIMYVNLPMANCLKLKLSLRGVFRTKISSKKVHLNSYAYFEQKAAEEAARNAHEAAAAAAVLSTARVKNVESFSLLEDYMPGSQRAKTLAKLDALVKKDWVVQVLDRKTDGVNYWIKVRSSIYEIGGEAARKKDRNCNVGWILEKYIEGVDPQQAYRALAEASLIATDSKLGVLEAMWTDLTKKIVQLEIDLSNAEVVEGAMSVPLKIRLVSNELSNISKQVEPLAKWLGVLIENTNSLTLDLTLTHAEQDSLEYLQIEITKLVSRKDLLAQKIAGGIKEIKRIQTAGDVAPRTHTPAPNTCGAPFKRERCFKCVGVLGGLLIIFSLVAAVFSDLTTSKE